jgi:hypothetical protein
MSLLDTKSYSRKRSLDHIDRLTDGTKTCIWYYSPLLLFLVLYVIRYSTHSEAAKISPSLSEASCMTPRQQHHILRIPHFDEA